MEAASKGIVGLLAHVEIAVDEMEQARMRQRSSVGATATPSADAALAELLSVTLDTGCDPPTHKL
eukprot:COSAG02_NODE_32165_length_521_cov_0.732227_2_plen_64_part_01